MKLNVLLFLFFLTGPAQAQTQLIRQWTSFHNGAQANHDYAKALITDNYGNVYVTGRSFENNVTGSLTTVCYDATGNMVWTDFYKGPVVTAINEGLDICMDPFGNVLVTGTVAYNDGDFAILKFNQGGRLWAKSKEPYWFGSGTDEGREIATDAAGNIFCTASIQSLSGNMQDLYILKCDSAGNDTWSIDYSSASGEDWAEGIAVTPDGHSFSISSSYNFFGSATYDMQTLYHDSSGAQQWISSYNFQSAQSDDYPTDIKCDAAYNSWVCGAADVGSHSDMAAYKQNIYGTRLWVATYNGSANEPDTAVAIVPLPNNLTAVTGKTRELVNGIARSVITTQLIDSGTVLWTNWYYGDSIGAEPTAMMSDTAGNIYISGYYQTAAGSNAIVLVYDLNGNLAKYDEYDGPASMDDRFSDVFVDAGGFVYATGYSKTSSANSDFVTVKYSPLVQQVSDPASGQDGILVFPNPTTDEVRYYKTADGTHHLELYDETGKQLLKIKSGLYPGYVSLPLATLENGMYFLRIQTGETVITKKIIKQ